MKIFEFSLFTLYLFWLIFAKKRYKKYPCGTKKRTPEDEMNPES